MDLGAWIPPSTMPFARDEPHQDREKYLMTQLDTERLSIGVGGGRFT